MTTIVPDPELATGGNVKNFDTPTVQAAPGTVTILPALICIAYIIFLMIWSMNTNPQPYVTGNTFHGTTNFTFTWLTIPAILLAPLPAALLTHQIMRVTLPSAALTRDREWSFNLICAALAAFLATAFVTFLPFVGAASNSDPRGLPDYPVYLSNTLHIKHLDIPDKNGTIAANTTDGRILKLAYKTTPNGYTLTLLNPDTPKPGTTNTPAFQLPGTTGTVHTKDTQGNPLTYTYTRDKNGHYTINIR